MEFYSNQDDVRCEVCGEHPENIIWDYDYDYDGNDQIHEQGKYQCQCGEHGYFSTNDPYEDEDV